MASVFISYSHQSRPHVQHVLELGQRLRDAGFDVALDQFVKFPKEGWAAWAERQIQHADHVVVVGSRAYLRRYSGEERRAIGHGATHEAAIIRQLLYEAGSKNTRFVPIVFGRESTNTLPPLLRQYQVYKLWRDWHDLLSQLSGRTSATEPERRRAIARQRPGAPADRAVGHAPWLDAVRGRHLLETGLDAIARKCQDVAVSLLILDVDNLTQINKRFGQGVGDRVLHELGRVCISGVGDQHAGRCGHDTFFVVAIGADLAGAGRLAGKLRERLRQIEWRRIAQGLHVSFSGGIAERRPGERGVHWAMRAAQGMTAAKEKGGNSVEQGPLFLANVAPANSVPSGKAERPPRPRFTLVADEPGVRWPFS
jgi:diguanylate cyclase (GGDEF)-like protein